MGHWRAKRIAQANVEFVSNFFEINEPHVRGEKLP